MKMVQSIVHSNACKDIEGTVSACLHNNLTRCHTCAGLMINQAGYFNLHQCPSRRSRKDRMLLCALLPSVSSSNWNNQRLNSAAALKIQEVAVGVPVAAAWNGAFFEWGCR